MVTTLRVVLGAQNHYGDMAQKIKPRPSVTVLAGSVREIGGVREFFEGTRKIGERLPPAPCILAQAALTILRS
jgi:hypothetical protein